MGSFNMATALFRRLPIVVILGPTGAGKSKLAIEIGTRMNGEIISADSMQIYKGLDIITNKVTPEEQAQCKHHMIDRFSPLIETLTVVHFRNEALPIINDIMQRKKLPIIVGGTNYYIESLLWENLVSKQAEELDKLPAEYKDKRTEDLYEELKAIDLERAMELHPHDRRKISRSLQVFCQQGIAHSTLLKRQHSRQGGSLLSGPLRYNHTCIFWLTSDKTVLNERLDKRVETMIERGLVDELSQFHREFNECRMNLKQEFPDEDPYTTGIFQSIGFKEFHQYLILSEEERDSEEGQRLLSQGVANLKLVTRRYAKRQNSWVRNRFLQRPGSNFPLVYGLDSTVLEEWDSKVLDPALAILTSIINGEEPTITPLKHEESANVNKKNRHFCEICSKTIFGDQQWKVHLKSGKHHKAEKKTKKSYESKKMCEDSMNISGDNKEEDDEIQDISDFFTVTEKLE